MKQINSWAAAGILVFFAVSAWPKGFYVEGAGGVNLSKVAATQDYKDFNTLSQGSELMRTGFDGGIGFGYRGNGSFGFVTGLYYENKGNRSYYEQELTTSLGQQTTRTDVKWDFNYITVPLQGEVTVPLKPGALFLRLGIGLSYLQNATTEETVNNQPIGEYLNGQYQSLDQAYYYGEITLSDYAYYAWIFENALRQDSLATNLAFKKYDVNLIVGLGYEYVIKNIGIFIKTEFSYGLMEIQQTQYLEQIDELGYPYSQKLSGTVKNLSGNVVLGFRRYF